MTFKDPNTKTCPTISWDCTRRLPNEEIVDETKKTRHPKKDVLGGRGEDLKSNGGVAGVDLGLIEVELQQVGHAKQYEPRKAAADVRKAAGDVGALPSCWNTGKYEFW